jgi:hypothetical protein
LTSVVLLYKILQVLSSWYKEKDKEPVGPFDFAEYAETAAFKRDILNSQKLLKLKLF